MHTEERTGKEEEGEERKNKRRKRKTLNYAYQSYVLVDCGASVIRNESNNCSVSHSQSLSICQSIYLSINLSILPRIYFMVAQGGFTTSMRTDTAHELSSE